jgi:hypothetical protein
MSEYLTEIKDYNGKDVVFVITPDGDQLIPVRVLADHFGIPLKKANQMITKNNALFVDKVVKLKKEAYSSLGTVMGPDEDIRSFDCFTLAGSIQWVNLLQHSRYSDSRKATIIDMKNWLVSLGASVIQGKALGGVPRGEVRIISSELQKTIVALLKEKIVDKYEDGGQHPFIYSNEMKMLNKIGAGEHQPKIKDTLSAAGIQVHNTGQISDIALLNANVTDYQTRKSAISATVDMIHSGVDKKSLRLTESEMAREKKCLPKSQTVLCIASGGL